MKQEAGSTDLKMNQMLMLQRFTFLHEATTAFLLCDSEQADGLMTDLATFHDRESRNNIDDVARRCHCQPQLQPVRSRDLPDGIRSGCTDSDLEV